jgi:hypothetical protein
MSVAFDAWRSSHARPQARRNMQSLAFLWFDLQLARGRLQEAFAEPELPANAANLKESGGSPVIGRDELLLIRRDGSVPQHSELQYPVHPESRTRTSTQCLSTLNKPKRTVYVDR